MFSSFRSTSKYPLENPLSGSVDNIALYNKEVGTQNGGYLNLAVSITNAISESASYAPIQLKWPCSPVCCNSFPRKIDNHTHARARLDVIFITIGNNICGHSGNLIPVTQTNV